jgi:hypothetical protein
MAGFLSMMICCHCKLYALIPILLFISVKHLLFPLAHSLLYSVDSVALYLLVAILKFWVPMYCVFHLIGCTCCILSQALSPLIMAAYSWLEYSLAISVGSPYLTK